MAAANYDEALLRMLAHEGGYANHPSDPGGPTNFGITLATYRQYRKRDATAADIRAMTIAEAKAIYRAKYWDALRCDELPPGVDYTVFDYGVNSGIGRSGKVLRRILGLPDQTFAVTDQVLQAVSRRTPRALIAAINDERLAFLKQLKTWPVFGAGWNRRVSEVRATSLRMTAPAQPAPSVVTDAAPTPGKGAVPPPAVAKNVVVSTGTATPVAVGGSHWDWVAAHPWTSGALACLVVLAVGGALYLLARRHQRAQDAAIPNTPVVPALTS